MQKQKLSYNQIYDLTLSENAIKPFIGMTVHLPEGTEGFCLLKNIKKKLGER